MKFKSVATPDDAVKSTGENFDGKALQALLKKLIARVNELEENVRVLAEHCGLDVLDEEEE